MVHGDVPDEVLRMHAAVCDAKRAGMAAARAGVTGEDVHRATIAAIVEHGYKTGLPPADAPDDYCAMTHGTGHGVGLECHEPPLLDFKGPELLEGELVTIEPGLYRRGIGGVRVEDIVLIHSDRCETSTSFRKDWTGNESKEFDRKMNDRKMECDEILGLIHFSVNHFSVNSLSFFFPRFFSGEVVTRMLFVRYFFATRTTSGKVTARIWASNFLS